MMSDFSYHKLIAKSACILDLLKVIDKAAITESSVLLTGESGVGKELFAEQVHLRSKRRDRPFIRVNCAAIPETLLESELFGHVKGAFTDAVKDRPGRFSLADTGTIFLDEIADLPLILQMKLLRVIQERKFEKVGSDTTVNADVRIIAATNKDLEKQVQEGLFREDLYYRLNVLPLYIPPLRHRIDDIMELAGFFLIENMKKTGKSFDGFSQDAVSALLAYSWPGNIRELQNYVERACIVCNTRRIKGSDLFFSLNGQKPGKSGSRDLKAAVSVFKANYVKNVLEECGWNQTEAAGVLAIQRTYLSKLIKEHKIKHDEHK